MEEPPRRFPPPWRADTIPGGYVVRDANGQALTYIYARDTEVEARQTKVLTKDEARRVAVNIARLPELLGKLDQRLPCLSGMWNVGWLTSIYPYVYNVHVALFWGHHLTISQRRRRAQKQSAVGRPRLRMT
jgi:hypothetical protein